MTLSIIIPTYNRPIQVQQLLRSIAWQNFPSKDLQVLLISNFRDNILRKTSSYWQNLFFDFKYLETGRKGVNKARNMGIRFARGDILYFLDDDCFLENKDHLSLLVSAHEKPAIGIGGGYNTLEDSHGLEKFYQDNTEEWIRKAVLEKQTEGLSKRGFSGKPVKQLVGGNSSYKREVFDKGFYFDPSIVFGGSEEGFNQSLRDQAWNLLFMSELNVLHKLRISWLSFIKKSFKQGLGSVKSYSKLKSHKLEDEWAFLYKDSYSVYSLVYSLFFKLGFFWGLSGLERQGGLFKFLKFISLFLKSRWYFFKELFRKIMGFLYGKLLLRPLGKLWYVLGWLYGSVFLKGLGVVWYVLGWLYGKVLWPVYAKFLLRPLGKLWYVLGWLYGSVFLKGLGVVWYVLGWLYGKVFLFLFYHSPPMKIYYFSRYQYHKRIKPLLNKKRKSNFLDESN